MCLIIGSSYPITLVAGYRRLAFKFMGLKTIALESLRQHVNVAKLPG